jgi:hypothetical protein
MPPGAHMRARPEFLSPNHVTLSFDEPQQIHNLVRTLKIMRKVIMYCEASPSRSAQLAEFMLQDYPMLKRLSLHLPPDTRWAWVHLSSENFMARLPSIHRFVISNAYYSSKNKVGAKADVVPLEAFLVYEAVNPNEEIVQTHGDQVNVMKVKVDDDDSFVPPPPARAPSPPRPCFELLPSSPPPSSALSTSLRATPTVLNADEDDVVCRRCKNVLVEDTALSCSSSHTLCEDCIHTTVCPCIIIICIMCMQSITINGR